MKPLTFATTNEVKFNIASSAALSAGVELKRLIVEVKEIQGEDPEEVAADKAEKVFNIVKQPVVVSDDSWNFVGLGGFPGVYMKSINAWFKAEDFLRLVDGHDRTVFLTQMLVYKDKNIQKVFSRKTEGYVLDSPKGSAPASGNWEVTTMKGDDGLSIAEVYQQKRLTDRVVSLVWKDLLEWYKQSG